MPTGSKGSQIYHDPLTSPGPAQEAPVTRSDDATELATETPAPTQTRRLRWWIAGITFVVGFVFGVIAVGLLDVTTPSFGTAGGRGSTPIAGGPTPGGGVPVVAEARVNAACLAVINEAQDAYTVLTGLGQAVTDVDLQALDDIVRRLQPIEARLGRDLQSCQVDASVVSEPTGAATPQPTGTPTR
jgi:hypothetical protein